MEYQMTPSRRDRYVYQSILDFEQANRTPIDGYENENILSLEEAVQPVLSFLNDNLTYVNTAKENCIRHSTDLTWDQSAAIYLYTMSTPLFTHLNRSLRDEDRHALTLWFPFLKLFMSALQTLPSSEVRVWRGVGSDLRGTLTSGTKTWWSVNSTSKDLHVVQTYVADGGTLFLIEAIDGKVISEYSSFPDENEVILLPGSHLRVSSEPTHFLGRLLIVHLIQEKLREDALSREDPETYYDADSDTDQLLPVPEHTYEVLQYETHQARRYCTRSNPLVITTIGIGLLIAAIIYFSSSAKKSQSTSLFRNEVLHNWTSQTTLTSSKDIPITAEFSNTIRTWKWSTSMTLSTQSSSTTATATTTTTSNELTELNSRFCFPVGWSATAEIIANDGLYSAVAIDEHFNAYLVDRSRKSLEKWSPYGRFIQRFFDDNFDTASPLFFHSPSQSLYFGYVWKGESSIYKLHVDSSTPVKVINHTMLTLDARTGGRVCVGLYLDSMGDIFVSLSQQPNVLKWSVNSTSAIVVADAYQLGSTISQPLSIANSAIDERNSIIYLLDRNGPRVLKFLNGSRVGTVIVDERPREIFSNVKRKRFQPSMIVVDQSGYFLLAEIDQISIWSADGKSNLTAMKFYRTVGNKENRLVVPELITLDNLGNLYVIDHRVQGLIKFNRTAMTCAN